MQTRDGSMAERELAQQNEGIGGTDDGGEFDLDIRIRTSPVEAEPGSPANEITNTCHPTCAHSCFGTCTCWHRC